MKKKETKQRKRKIFDWKLLRFNRLIAESLNSGERYLNLEECLVRECNIPIATSKVYMTMVINYLDKTIVKKNVKKKF